MKRCTNCLLVETHDTLMFNEAGLCSVCQQHEVKHKIDWDSRTINWMKEEKYPNKFKFYYAIENLPLPWILKLPYAHLFYVIGEKEYV